MEELKVTKISVSSIEVEKTIPEEIIPATVKFVVYERGFIESQIKSITQQRDGMIAEKENLIALKEKELKECEDILAQMNALGVVSQKEPEPELPTV